MPFAVPLIDDLQGRPVIELRDERDFAVQVNALPVNAPDHVACLDPGFHGRAVLHDRLHDRQIRPCECDDDQGKNKAKDQIGERSRKDRCDARKDRCVREGPLVDFSAVFPLFHFQRVKSVIDA